MTPRSLFNIILKIFGIFFLREIIVTIPEFFSSLLSLINNDFGSAAATTIVFALVITMYTLIVFQLLFKTNKFIDLLKLDQGFDEDQFSFEQPKEFDINISTTLVLTIALIVTGGIILTDEIPNLCRRIYNYMQEKNSRYNPSRPDMSYIVLSIAKILLGLLILGERKRIVDIIEGRKTYVEAEAEPEE
jgi:hypothetical protein